MEIKYLIIVSLAVLFPILMGYCLFVKSSKRQTKDKFSRLAKSYSFKKTLARLIIKKLKNSQQKKLKDLKKYENESPKVLSKEDCSESHLFYGADYQGNLIFLKFAKHCCKSTENILVLRLKNESSYATFTFQDQPKGKALNSNFKDSDLKLECLQPYSKWRLSFIGIMRKETKERDEHEFFFVRLNMFWTAASFPSFWPFEWNSELMATAIASEKWEGYKIVHQEDSEGFRQFGACNGQIRIYDNNFEAYKIGQLPKIETIELNLPGMRIRLWEVLKSKHLKQTVSLLGTMRDGTVFEVGAFTSSFGFKNAQFGNVRVPNGDVLSVNWTNFHINSFEEFQDHIPRKLNVKIEAGERKLNFNLTFREKISLKAEQWSTSIIIPVDIFCAKTPGFGFAIINHSRERNMETIEDEFLNDKVQAQFFAKSQTIKCTKKVLTFAEKEAQRVSIAGGKGKSLALLEKIKKFSYQEQFYLPEGLIVTVLAFEEHLQNFPEISRMIAKLELICYEKIEGNIKDACLNVQSTFLSSKLNKGLRIGIVKIIKKLPRLSKNNRYAVRSSGITEDANELSSAGQNQTFLGLKSNEEIFDAILKCWSSLYSYQSVMYRKQNIQSVSTSMAVVIQKMVDPASAGVLFSRHFQSGDPRVIVICANYGLGESVVSGKSEPDTFLIKRDHETDNLEILATIVGDKKIIIKMDGIKSTKEVEIDDEKRKKACLSSETILRLARLAVMLENFYGSPRDIEFAVTEESQIYLLQSRPITALNNYTDYEIKHERDAAIMSCEDILTKANIGEILGKAICSLNLSTLSTGFGNQLERNRYKNPEKLIYQKYFPSIQNHVFIDAHKVIFPFLSRDTQIIDEAMFLGVFGHDVLEIYPEIKKICLHRNDDDGNITMKKLGHLKILGEAWWNINSYIKNGNMALLKLKSSLNQENISKVKTSSEIVDLIGKELKTIENIERNHYATSSYSLIYQIISFSILLNGAKKITIEHQRDVTRILSSIGNIRSANIPESIKEIVNSIKDQHKEKDFLKIEPSKGVQWLKEECQTGYELFVNFIENHGHRGPYELDLLTKPWGMQPEKIIEMIQTNLRLGCFEFEPKNENKDVLEEDLKTPLGFFSKILLKKIIPYHHKAVQRREESKSVLVNAVNELRKAFMWLSQKMVNEGLLPDRNLIFHLTLWEIQLIIQTRNSRLINNAIRRQKIHDKLCELNFEEIVFGFPRPISEKKKQEVFEEGNVLARGLPVCSGTVTARACVINTLAEIHKLQKGDILVTHSTDIGWSPYFPLLGGICTELGGLISHGAVVARECNLPCIVGAIQATKKINHGQLVRLIGDEGLIIKAQ